MNNNMHIIKCSMCAKCGFVPAGFYNVYKHTQCIDGQEGSKTNSKGPDNEP